MDKKQKQESITMKAGEKESLDHTQHPQVLPSAVNPLFLLTILLCINHSLHRYLWRIQSWVLR